MINKKSNKKALFNSSLSLGLSCAMLLGSTFAWFTDTASTGKNTIQSGKFDVDLVGADGNSLEGNTTLFVGNNDNLWEPGESFSTVPMYVENKGDIALKYKFQVNGISGDEKLLNAIDFTVNGVEIDGAEYTIAPQAKSNEITITATMKESAGNEYQGLSIEDFGVTVVATQNKENAIFPTVTTTSSDLGNKLTGKLEGTSEIVVTEDVSIDTNGLAIGSSSTEEVIIDGKGTATFTATGAGVYAMKMANPNATLTFKNITIVDKSESYKENNWELGYLEFAGKIKFENCTFLNAIMLEGDTKAEFNNCKFISSVENEYAAWLLDGKATFTNCQFEGYRAIKTHEAYGSDVESLVVNNCTFNNISKKPGIAIGDVDPTTVVTISNSNFNNCQPGDQNMYIYESDTDVTTFRFTEVNNTIQ